MFNRISYSLKNISDPPFFIWKNLSIPPFDLRKIPDPPNFQEPPPGKKWHFPKKPKILYAVLFWCVFLENDINFQIEGCYDVIMTS